MEPDKAQISGALALAGPCQIAAAAGDKKERRFEMLLYTGGPLEQSAMGWSYPVIVDLEGVQLRDGVFPILDNHGPSPASDVSPRNYLVGQSDSAKVEKDGLVLRGKLLTNSSSAAADIAAKADEGFRWQASIGARSLRKEFVEEGGTVNVNGRDWNGPLYVSRVTMLREGSFVVTGADPDTLCVVASGSHPGGNQPRRPSESPTMKFSEYCKAKGHDMSKLDATMRAKLKADYKADGHNDDDDDAEAKAAAQLDIKARADREAQDLQARANREAEAITAAMRQKVTAEQDRLLAIQKICAADSSVEVEVDIAGKTSRVPLLQHAISAGWSAEKCELEYLRATRNRNVTPNQSPFFYSVSQPEVNEAVLEAAVLQAGQCRLWDEEFMTNKPGEPRRWVGTEAKRCRDDMNARYTDKVQQAAHTVFKSRIGLQQILLACALSASRGVGRLPRSIQDDGDLETVLRAAFTPDIRATDSSSYANIANVLANVMNKFLLQGYKFVESAWREICATRPVKDFKPTKSINLLGDFVFDELGADGKIKHARILDQAFANQAKTYARMAGIDRQLIINDDLSALTTMPVLLGRGSGLKLNDVFWTLFLSPGFDDGGTTNFFAATHTLTNGQVGNSNLISGGSSALSSTSLATAKATFDKQVDPFGKPMGVDAAIMLFPPELWQTAMGLIDPNATGIVYGGSTAAKDPNINLWRGRFKAVMSRYLSNSSYTGNSTTAWWLLAEPGVLPVIEAAFLGGQEQPTVQTAQADFNTLGIVIRGFNDFGVAMQNFRGGLKSAGA